MLLSCRPAIGLAAEIIGKTNDVRVGPGKRMLLAAQQWASQQVTAKDALEACRWGAADQKHAGRTAYVGDGRWELLVNALRRATEAELLAANGDPDHSAARDLEARQIVRQIIRATYGHPPPMAPAVAMRYQSNVAWQTDQLQQLLTALVASEEDLWPK